MRTATNQTTIAQGFRLIKAGCPHVGLHMQEAAHKIVPDPIPLGRLWDIAHQIGVTTPFTPPCLFLVTTKPHNDMEYNDDLFDAFQLAIIIIVILAALIAVGIFYIRY